MIILDTNVLSALMQKQPPEEVVAWLDRQPAESVWTSTITLFEIQFGLELLASGRRRTQLEELFERAIAEDFDGRIVSFDAGAAREAARLAAVRRRAGRGIDFRDVEIAGIVASRRATLATRNVRHFQGMSIDLVDPWSA